MAHRLAALLAILLATAPGWSQGSRRMTQREMIEQVLANTPPLRYPRGERLPFYFWHLGDVGTDDDAEAERILRALDERGLAVVPAWNPNPARRDASLAAGLRIARLQRRLGLEIGVNANACTYSFFNGDESTAHIDDQGHPFFDLSFSEHRPMGCPFAVAHRYDAIREQVEFFAAAYEREGLPIHFAFADWEIDGPIEWNDAWDHSKRCVRCREQIPYLDDFRAFQTRLRAIRSDMQRRCYAEPMRRHHPNVLVGNYAVYPHGGLRYWYDYFEREPGPGIPVVRDQRAPYRPWADEFDACGYTFAMPVVYTWYPIFDWYDFPDPDYRWFYNLLLVGTNAGRHTPPSVPIITFIHQHTTSPPPEPAPHVKPISAQAWQELLWHLLLRGHDTFFIWSPQDEAIEELNLAHPVWAAALEYRDFLDHGTPISFHVPRRPGPVVSGLRLGDRVLVRRTDFGDTAPVELLVDGRPLRVPAAPGRCQLISVGG